MTKRRGWAAAVSAMAGAAVMAWGVMAAGQVRSQLPGPGEVPKPPPYVVMSGPATSSRPYGAMSQPFRPPPGVQSFRDIEYARPGGKPQLLDVYVPEKAEGKLPLVVWVHGGAWLAGSKDRPPGLFLVPRSYVVASINYRLSQEAVFPAQIEDCKAAIRWLRANASTYHIDPDRIGVWGGSAGGHLVALLGTTGNAKELEGDGGNAAQSSKVQAVVDFFGPTDFAKIIDQPSHLKHAATDSPEAKLLGGIIRNNLDKVAKANPIAYITKDCPPFLIMHGDKDMTVPINQSQLLYDALKKAGIDATYQVVAGAGHGFGGPEINKTVGDFFDKQLKKP